MIQSLEQFLTFLNVYTETVHHVVLNVDPRRDESWKTLCRHVSTGRPKTS